MRISRTQDRQRRHNRQRALAFALVGLGVVGIGAASASQLTVTGGRGDVASGVVTVEGASTTAVTANLVLDPTINPDGSFTVQHVALTGLDPDDGQVTVIARGADGTAIATGADTISGGSMDIELTREGGDDPITNWSGIASLAVVVTPAA